ncbi:MAG: hypothetical protein AB7V13_08310 [Pseudorhodoplanes sp.]
MREFLRLHCRDRFFEWVMTLAMLALALHLTVWPQAIAASAFRYLLLVFTPAQIALLFFAAGAARAAALVLNGRWRWGAHCRAGSAFLAMMLWSQMDLALVMLIPKAGTPPSPGIPVYFALAFGELVSCYRVLAHARYQGA